MSRAEQAQYSFGRTKSEQDLYSVLTPVTWFCQVFGIFPLRIKGPAGKRKYSTSHILIFYNITALVLSTTGLFKSVWILDEKMMNLPNRMLPMVNAHMEIIIATCSVIVTVIMAIITRDKFANAVDTMSLQDLTLRKLGTRLNYAADMKRYYMRLGTWISVMIVHFSYDFILQLNFNYRYPLVWIALTYPNLVRIASTCLFGDIIYALRQRFAILNEHLRKMIEETKRFSPETISILDSSSERLRTIAKVHGALYAVALNVNKTFGLNIIVGVVCSLKILVTTMYCVTQEIGGHIDLGWMPIVGFFNWEIITFVHIVYLVTACNLAQNQASLTGKLIHKFQINKGATSFNTMLRSFALQLYHERLEFTAAGLFPLDATLFQSFVGGVATFLVILLQFDMSSSRQVLSQGTNNSLNGTVEVAYAI